MFKSVAYYVVASFVAASSYGLRGGVRIYAGLCVDMVIVAHRWVYMVIVLLVDWLIRLLVIGRAAN